MYRLHIKRVKFKGIKPLNIEILPINHKFSSKIMTQTSINNGIDWKLQSNEMNLIFVLFIFDLIYKNH